MTYAIDRLVVMPDDIDLSQSPLAGQLGEETYVLGAFNPGMTRLANGNLLLMVRIAEALRTPIRDGHVRAIRWEESGCREELGRREESGGKDAGSKGRYRLDAWPLDQVDTADPRKFLVRGGVWEVMALTSLSWLLPVELSPDGLERVAIHYDRAIAPRYSFQCYGLEDARISKVGDRYLMTSCSVSPERQSTTLYSSPNGLDWTFEDIVLDHQNKDMLIFEGLIAGHYWAQTRPLGDLYFTYPPTANGWPGRPSIWRPRPMRCTGSPIASPACGLTPQRSRPPAWARARRRSRPTRSTAAAG
jgi:predicted GH43/DUF377 family glycosyl hydrolase